jgi:hypothetical protein
MASTFSKRLAKLEELLASKINQPLATLWPNAGETREQACIRCGYDPSQLDRIRFVRWLDPALGEATPPPAPLEYGPPSEEPVITTKSSTPQQTEFEELIANRPSNPKDAPIEPDLEAETRYRAAIEQREREIVQEKLAEATARFAKSIV